MSTNFTPTPAELSLVSQIFAQHDPQKLGVLTGDVAVRVFGGAKLAPTTLGEIWNISDEDNKGWLPKKGVAIAVRLIGWAQKGEKVTQALTNKPGPLAVIDGINVVAQQSTGMSMPKSPPPIAFPVLTPQDKTRFQDMFLKYGPENGLLNGEKARDVFVRSKLPNEMLLKIWNLADTQDRGALDSTDFTIGMYFIQGVMSGKISFVPTTLPPGLYQQAGGGPSNTGSVRSHTSSNSGSFSPVGSVFLAQQTGQSQPMLQPDYTGQPFKAPSLPARPNTAAHTNGHPHDWDVTAADKAASDGFFDTLDTSKNGYIEGEVAVPFMIKSNLPGEVLAQVWDLADINNDGRLTRDGFAVAMHLIKKKLSGQNIPATLPPSLVPPSARAAATQASPFSPLHQQTHQPQEPAVDLFSFDDTPPQSAVSPPPMQAIYTGNLQTQMTGSTSAAVQPTIPARRPQVEADPFSSSPFQPPQNRDFFGDDDTHPVTSPPLQDKSAEIGNLKNQLQSTNRSLAAAKEEREALEQTLANQASQLSTMQTQLSSAKAAYETETNLLTTFQERRAAQLADIDKTRHELISAESNVSSLRAEKAEIEGAFLRDKEEARDLHKRMVEAGQQAEALKADVEKLKKEAKQQKGLLAIARKQLSTKEAERAKYEKEHEESVTELASITHDKETTETEISNVEAFLASPPAKPVAVAPASPPASLMFAAAQPLPATPELSSPTKSNNPFERLAMASGTSTPRSQSPFLGLTNTIISSPPLSIAETFSPPVLQVAPEPSKELAQPDDIFSSQPENHSTELSYLGDELSEAHAQEIGVSPDTANGTDYFMTPPTSARHDSASPTFVAEKFPSLHDVSLQAQSAEKVPSIAPESSAATAPVPARPETDLNAQLQELDVEESDSDDDSDEDYEKVVPGAFTASNGNGVPATISPPKDGNDSAPAPIQAQAPAPIAAQAPINSFDDVFGSDEPSIVPTGNGNATPFDLPPAASDHPKDLFDIKPVEQTPAVAGVNEFDEALGKVTGSTTTTPATFSFDSAFDDNFDFASASKASETVPVPQVHEQAKVTPQNTFDDTTWMNTSTLSGPSSLPAAGPPATSMPNTLTTFGSSFDQTFAGFDAVSPPKLDETPFGVPPQVAAAANGPSVSTPMSFPSSPVQSQPVATSPRVSEIRTASPPPRTKTPPPRVVSPKPRVASSSSKEPQEKAKETATRHSKLSIRLPFGKKKKQADPMPPPPQHLSPPMEELSRTASSDDVEAVKQLTAMGFSRDQAVEALEAQSYDVQKALNSLLGQ